jgi:hypothetical protein
MRTLFRLCAPALAVAFALAAPAPTRAAFHFWDIKEIFSTADGAVQFIEFVCGAATGEHFLDNHALSATSDGATVNYTFDANLNTLQSTANRHFLAATAGFGALAGGVTPNYVIPANFFNPSATSITINFASNTDIVTFAGAALPKDGVMSLTDQSPFGVTNLAAGVNSPTNFAGVAGSVNLGGPTFDAGDFDEDGQVDAADLAAWRTGFGTQGVAVDHGDGDANDDNDVDGADFLTWQQQLGASSVAAAHAAPEPATAALLAVVLVAGAAQRRGCKQSRQRRIDR